MARGRKRKPESQQQNQKITVWLTVEEKEKLIQRAGLLPVSRYFRETLLRGRAPKQPPVVPSPNWKAYRELAGHMTVLRELSNQFKIHTEIEQAQALRNYSEQIREMLEKYRISLITLSTAEKGHDFKDK